MSNFVILERRADALASANPPGRAAYSLEAAADLAGVHPEMIRYFCRLGVVTPVRGDAGSDPVFDDDAIYEMRRVEHFRRYYGVSRRALPLISRLLRDVARLEAELRSRGNPECHGGGAQKRHDWGNNPLPSVSVLCGGAHRPPSPTDQESAMTTNSIESTIRSLLSPGKGILAADESFPTIGRRFKELAIASTEENRRAYRGASFSRRPVSPGTSAA